MQGARPALGAVLSQEVAGEPRTLCFNSPSSHALDHTWRSMTAQQGPLSWAWLEAALFGMEFVWL